MVKNTCLILDSVMVVLMVHFGLYEVAALFFMSFLYTLNTKEK